MLSKYYFATNRKIYLQLPWGGGHLNMKVTGKYLPENENMAYSVLDFVEKSWSLGVGF